MDDQTREKQWAEGSLQRLPTGLLILGGAILALAALAVLRTWLESRVAPPEKQLPLVSVLVPGAQDVIDVVTFAGAINARDEIPISVEGEGGRIAAVLVEVGDLVRLGQTLARLDNSILAPQVGSLEAGLDEARANAEIAEADLKRAQAVSASGALSAQDLERRRSAVISARAKVKVAAAQVAEARARLRRIDIRAPADGLVLTRSAEVGQTATAGSEPLFRMSRGGEIEMRGRVAEQDLTRLVVGQTARVTVTGVAEPFIGRVRLLGAVIDPQTRLGSIRIELQRSPNLRPGAFARGAVEVARAVRPVIPQTAVLADTQGTYVLVVGADSRVARRNVRVGGTRTDGLVIATGLDGREQVVSTAAAFLREGESVRVLKSVGAAAESAS